VLQAKAANKEIEILGFIYTQFDVTASTKFINQTKLCIPASSHRNQISRKPVGVHEKHHQRITQPKHS